MADLVGQQLGNYRVIRQIGRGGFAEVYLGEHIYLRTQVAIKLLQSKVGNEEDLESFLNEARTIAHLVHPNIIRVMDFGVDHETPFLVMDYAPNGTLRQRHARGTQLPLPTIVSYVKQIAAALQHAHNEKLIHRDVKPENMLLGRNNDVLLSDFGIALIAQSSRYQSTQDVIGTVAYMSPEQIQGKPRPASDQYSLGIVVYEWLCGDRPFRGSFTELCVQHVMAPVPLLREKLPTVLPDVEQVIVTALAKDPKQRFGSVQAFAHALEQAAQEKRPSFVKPQPVSPPQPTPSPAPQRHVQPPSFVKPQPVQYPQPTPHYAAPSPFQPLPPTQYAVPSPFQQASFSASANIPAGMRPSAGPSNVQISVAESKNEHVSMWQIGRQQKVAGAIGFAIVACLSLFTDFLFYQGNFGYIIGLIFLSLVLITPEFFGAVFGPWVGLFTTVGIVLGYHYFSANFTLYLPLQFGFMLVGFISGFAAFKKKGRYNIRRTLGFCSLGAVVGSAIFVFVFSISGYWSDIGNVIKFTSGYALFYVVVGLILLPILLVIYTRIVSGRKRAG